MTIDPWILAFSAATVIVTIWMGFWSAKKSRTASDFFVAGRSVSVGWNASAISGEYLSAASFMGIAGMVMSSGYDALWYPVCYACGYLFLLLFIAGPLRRFGAYTIPDFAEGRFDSPLFRKIAVCFVLFIGFFYTMPQMKGAGTTLAYIFQDVDLRGGWLEFLAPQVNGIATSGLPYWAGVVIVGAVITLNVALGGMKGITLVQAFQYWLKMFAISVPIFVLMAVYGHYGTQLGVNGESFNLIYQPPAKLELMAREVVGERIADAVHLDRPDYGGFRTPALTLFGLLKTYGLFREKAVEVSAHGRNLYEVIPFTTNQVSLSNYYEIAKPLMAKYGFKIVEEDEQVVRFVSVRESTPVPESEIPMALARMNFEGFDIRTVATNQGFQVHKYEMEDAGEQGQAFYTYSLRRMAVGAELDSIRTPLPEKAPADSTWLSPFGPLTTKAAKAAKPRVSAPPSLDASNRVNRLTMTWKLSSLEEWARLAKEKWSHPAGGGKPTLAADVLKNYVEATVVSDLTQWGKEFQIIWSNEVEQKIVRVPLLGASSPAGFASGLKSVLETNGITVLSEPGNVFKAFPTKEAIIAPIDPKPYSLLYTYSLIIALVCGTAGLPHILVRFYTNPDGVAAKRTTMWVMILIGIFYVFPPVFGVMGRNLLPELYSGVGAKGTDKVVLELPRILNSHSPTYRPTGSPGGDVSGSVSESVSGKKRFPWGSILSGITCAGAFAAFMSTFSGLLVSMTGALAHDVYGRMLRPKSTPEQRMRMFRIGAVLLGSGAIIAGSFVEPLQINFMVGQAFAIAAASYFPLLFMSAWWRGMTMKGAAAGMLTGGLLALTGITLTSFSDLGWLKLADFWAANPLLRILCEQPAIWTVPLAIALMVIVSKLTRADVPSDIRMKMLVLHAPEKLGLKQEYIQEHHHGH
jgi:Na+(H+)/acetate symporter ActP